LFHEAAVPDNLKAGITKPSRYEPGVNRTYQDLADHYGFVVLPARVRRPRDKAKATPMKSAGYPPLRL
jgi:transposase